MLSARLRRVLNDDPWVMCARRAGISHIASYTVVRPDLGAQADSCRWVHGPRSAVDLVEFAEVLSTAFSLVRVSSSLDREGYASTRWDRSQNSADAVLQSGTRRLSNPLTWTQYVACMVQGM